MFCIYSTSFFVCKVYCVYTGGESKLWIPPVRKSGGSVIHAKDLPQKREYVLEECPITNFIAMLY